MLEQGGWACYCHPYNISWTLLSSLFRQSQHPSSQISPWLSRWPFPGISSKLIYRQVQSVACHCLYSKLNMNWSLILHVARDDDYPASCKCYQQVLSSLVDQSIRCHHSRTFWSNIFQSFKYFLDYSYLKAHSSFSIAVPLEVTSIERRNSLKSINPFLSASKVLKTWSQNSLVFPFGKHLL